MDVHELVGRRLIRVPGVGDLSDGERRTITARGRKLVVVRVGDERYACADQCLHLGVRLSDGHFDGSVVECRWHHWRFDLASGAVEADASPFSSFETYSVFVDGDDLLVDPRPRTRTCRRTDASGGGDCEERRKCG